MANLNLDELDEMLKKELNNIEGILKAEKRLQCVTHAEDVVGEDNEINVTTRTTVIEAAVDSGSVDNVMHPGELPEDIIVEANDKDSGHFVGANNTKIHNYGTCQTALKNSAGTDVQCKWSLAEVSRPLHSVSKMCGPIEAPRQDVLFNASRCVVVPAGVVDRVLQHIEPLIQYDRKGGLYVSKFTVSGFTRQGISA